MIPLIFKRYINPWCIPPQQKIWQDNYIDDKFIEVQKGNRRSNTLFKCLIMAADSAATSSIGDYVAINCVNKIIFTSPEQTISTKSTVNITVCWYANTCMVNQVPHTQLYLNILPLLKAFSLIRCVLCYKLSVLAKTKNKLKA